MDWLNSDSIKQARLFVMSTVANIFLFILKDILSKCGSSAAPGNESDSSLNVSISINLFSYFSDYKAETLRALRFT